MFGLVQDEQQKGDQVQVVEEIKFIIHKDLVDQYNRFSVDYYSNIFRKGYVVTPATGGSTC